MLGEVAPRFLNILDTPFLNRLREFTSMPKRNCAVKYVDTTGIEHIVRVEAVSLFDAAIRGLQRLQRLDSSFGADMLDRMSITVEVSAEPTTYAVMVQKLKPWIKSQENHPQKELNLRQPSPASKFPTTRPRT